MHWDDDDIHHADRVVVQAGPVLRGEAAMTTLQRTWLAQVDVKGGAVAWFDHLKLQAASGARKQRSQMSTLTYSRAIALATPFTDTSLGEDTEFAERVVGGCHAHALLTLPCAYVRHGSNSWDAAHGSHALEQLFDKTAAASGPPAGLIVDADIEAELLRAAEDILSHGACDKVHDFTPPQTPYAQRIFPHLPRACCVGADAADTPGCLSEPPPPPPRWETAEGLSATVVVLTCNRPKYVLLALRQIADQDYTGPLEALVVDDGTIAVEPLLRSEYPQLDVWHGADGAGGIALAQQPRGAGVVPHSSASTASAAAGTAAAAAAAQAPALRVRLLVMPRHVTIGEKRTAAAAAARGEVVVHWDDDDLHAPNRLSEQLAPIARGEADISALELAYVVALPALDVYASSLPDDAKVVQWSSLAYRASLGRIFTFANVSLAEDIDFADRVVRGCHRMAVVRGVQSMYTRHEGTELSNTYKFDLSAWVARGDLRKAAPPQWLAPWLASAAIAAEADGANHACPVVSLGKAPGFDARKATRTVPHPVHRLPGVLAATSRRPASRSRIIWGPRKLCGPSGPAAARR